MNADLTPVKIVKELDKYIIGQHDAKKAVAVALRNRWRRMQAPDELRQDIMPNNILMIGSTGVGKTEIARRLAQLADAPFIKVEASKFTEVGYVGRDVESMIRDLAEIAVNMVREQRKAECREKAKMAAENRLLDLLIPPVGNAETYVGFESNAEPTSDAEMNKRTRDKFREKLAKGELDDREVEIDVTVPSHNVQVMGNGMEGIEGLQEMLQNMVPKKQKKRKLPIREAREVFIEEEADKLIDMDAVTREAMERAESGGIVFIDEIDKVVARAEARSGPDVSREGVQRDLLPIIEGTTVNTKYGSLKTDHILFIAAGAFHLSKPSEMIPELQGRLPIRVELSPLTREDLVKILTQPKNALTKQYAALLQTEGVSLRFEPDAIETLAEMAHTVNTEVENIGARRLHTILSSLLEEVLFEIPDVNPITEFVVTKDLVNQRLQHLVQHQDMSAFIL